MFRRRVDRFGASDDEMDVGEQWLGCGNVGVRGGDTLMPVDNDANTTRMVIQSFI